MSHAYYAYLKSTERDPSADVVLHLWKKLETQKAATEHLLPQTVHPVTRSNMKISLERYKTLTTRAWEALNALANKRQAA